jgi:anti-sigma factor RsiW
MPDCSQIDALVTPYVDGELNASDRQAVAGHLHLCTSCHSRVQAEQAVHDALHARKNTLAAEQPSDLLRTRCAGLVRAAALERDAQRTPRSIGGTPAAPSRLMPFALAAGLVAIVGGAFVYRASEASTTIMAGELAADHLKCLMLNEVVGAGTDPAAVEQSLEAKFGWDAHLPENPQQAGLELVGERTCLYGAGRVAHIMYKHAGRPISVFMLPDEVRKQEVVQVLGHQAAVWSVGSRTFVLLAREPRADVERLATFVHASMR